MRARKRSRAHLLSQLRRAPGPFRCVGAEKSAGSARSAPAFAEDVGTAKHGEAPFLHRQQIGFGCSSRSRAGGNRAAAGIAGSDQAVPPQVDLDLENAAFYQKTGALEYSQDQINAYLAYRLTSKKTALNKPLLTFVRATASFRDGACTIGMERSLFGYSIYSRTSYQVDAGAGKISATNVGGWIGRFPIHPAIMRFGDIIFADLWSALERERKLLGKMGAVSFHDDGVTITAPAR